MDTPANPNIPPVSAPPPVPSVPPVNPAVNPAPPNPTYVQPPQSPTTPVFATFWQRFWAVVFDGMITGATVGIISIPFTIGSVFLGQTSQGTPSAGFFALSALSQLITITIYLAYYIYFIGKKGATPGKMIMKIRVIKMDSSEPIGYMGAFLREFVGKLLSSFFMLGYLTMPGNPNKQTWHDKIAGTIVIHA
ncbi:MAG: RDD family protein [Patescibacteria group bacterium]